MPTAPNHINCWLLDNGPGWTLVDCGLNTDDTFEMWDRLWRGVLRRRPPQKPALPHAPADHFSPARYFLKEKKNGVRTPPAEGVGGAREREEPGRQTGRR